MFKMEFNMGKIFLGLLAISIASPLFSQDKSSNQSRDTIVVGFFIQPPFIEEINDHYAGLSIDLVENLSRENNYIIEYRRYDQVDSLISGIQKGAYDMNINPSAPNLDLVHAVDFTHPFMVSNLAIAFNSEKNQVLMRLLRSIFSWNFLTGLAFVALIILLFGSLTWYFERKRNNDHFPNNAEGLWEAFWWSAVTMSTVGYGDKTPKTTGGRIVAISWMFTALLIVSGYTGSVASLLTVNELSLDIHSLDDLRKSKIVVVKNNTAEQFLLLSQIPYTTVSSTNEGLELVTDGKADALLHDETSIQHELSKGIYSNDIAIAPAKYSNKFFGFAMPINHPEFMRMNHAMIEVTNTLEWKINMGKYKIE